MTPALLTAGLAFIFAVLFLAGLALPPRDPIAVLRARYVGLSRVARPAAERELDERIDKLTRRFPGKTYGWYLQWLVRDLERAKGVR